MIAGASERQITYNSEGHADTLKLQFFRFLASRSRHFPEMILARRQFIPLCP